MKKKTKPTSLKASNVLDRKERQARELFNDEIGKAQDRFWGSDDATKDFRFRHGMEWILKLFKADLTSLSAGALADLQYEIAIFTDLGLAKDRRMVSSADWFNPHDSSWLQTLENEFLYVMKLHALPGPQAIKDLQVTTRENIEKILSVGRIDLSFPAVTIHLSDLDRRGTATIEGKGGKKTRVDSGWHRWISIDSPKMTFAYHLVDLLSKYAGYIRRCHGCHETFLADRGNQTYHSRQCYALYFMRSQRGTTPDRYGKRGRPPGSSKKRKNKKKEVDNGKKKRKR